MSGYNSTLTRRTPLRPGKSKMKRKKPIFAPLDKLQWNAPPPKRRTPLRQIGKRGSEWTKVRASLKREFEARGITTCEAKLPGCWRDNGLGFAHTRKRRNVTDLRRVALLCNHCHDEFERKPEPEMERLIEAIIAARK